MSKAILFAFIIGGVLLLCTFVMGPLWFRIKTRYWESQIRQYQNPEELQVWATKVLATYNESNIAELTCLGVTNRPPLKFLGATQCDVAIMDDKIWDGGYYVQLLWAANPFAGRWGMRIGDTNYVCSLPDRWKLGTYFFMEHNNVPPNPSRVGWFEGSGW